MELGISGRVALVAAGSKGLGRATAACLAAEGARVAICARGQAALEAAAEEIGRATGAEMLPVVADVSVAADCERFVEEAVRRWGTVHILVNNSGGPTAGGFADKDDAAWQAAVETTLLNVVRLTRLVLPYMRQQRWGRIVNIESLSVKQPIGALLLSNAIRPAVIGLAKTLADEVAADGVLVNNVLPGSHETDRLRELAAAWAEKSGRSAEEELGGMAEKIPVRRLGRPEELGSVVAFLCSERTSFVTGTSVQVDGGACRGLF
jgi:3-oxoacyl-[acyl-carrier protein] reductase